MFHQGLEPEFWIDLAATIFFAATVGLMLRDTFIQKKAQREGAYETLRNAHAEIVKLQIEQNDVLAEIWKKDKNQQPTNVDKTKREEKDREIFLFYVLVFDLYERIHWEIMHGEVLDTKKQRVNEWKYWLDWLEKIKNHWLFEYTFFSVFPVYEDDFVKNIAERFFPNKVEKLEEYWVVEELKEYGEEVEKENNMEKEKKKENEREEKIEEEKNQLKEELKRHPQKINELKEKAEKLQDDLKKH